MTADRVRGETTTRHDGDLASFEWADQPLEWADQRMQSGIATFLTWQEEMLIPFSIQRFAS